MKIKMINLNERFLFSLRVDTKDEVTELFITPRELHDMVESETITVEMNRKDLKKL